MSQEDPNLINAAAAKWIARLDRGDMTPDLQVELNDWLSEDERHAGAFLRAQSAWAMMDRASAPARRPAHAAAHASPVRPTRRALLYGGGSLLAAFVAGGIGFKAWQAPERFVTMAGEIRRVPLKDGSVATVNTQAAMSASLSADRRLVNLEKGEAWFQVARDEHRPFIVEAGQVRVQAIGTSFSVKRLGDAAEVQVTHGVIETWTKGNTAQRLRVAAGSRVLVDAFAGPEIRQGSIAEIERSLSWRFGEIIFDGESLGQAAAEFNRYNEIKVIIEDPQIAERTIIGRFRNNEPEAFADAAAIIADATAIRRDNEIHIRRSARK